MFKLFTEKKKVKAAENTPEFDAVECAASQRVSNFGFILGYIGIKNIFIYFFCRF